LLFLNLVLLSKEKVDSHKINGPEVANMVVFLPRTSTSVPPTIPPKRAPNGSKLPIHED
jgi:hypothetical protein